MLTDKLKAAILLHRELGVSYFQILKWYFKKDNNMVTIHIKNISANMDIYKALTFAYSLNNIKKYGWRISNISNNLILYENDKKGIRLYARIDDDYPYSGVIDEIFVKEVYKSDFANKIVIDVGAYRGESSIYFAINGAKRVIALEPDEENYELALMNVKENALENKIVMLNKALAPNEGFISFYKYYNSTHASSIDPNNMVKSNNSKLIVKRVEAMTLNQVIKIAGEERIGLLKLDCEGCEYSVLNSFSDFEMIDNIIMEYHNGLQNLPSLLKDHGFEVSIEKSNEKVGILRAYKK